jgi:hypothetical protein
MSSGRYGYIPRTESAYTVLGLENKTCYTDADISRAYRRASVQCHPDKPGGSIAAFDQLQVAYDLVKTNAQRQLYAQYGARLAPGPGDHMRDTMEKAIPLMIGLFGGVVFNLALYKKMDWNALSVVPMLTLGAGTLVLTEAPLVLVLGLAGDRVGFACESVSDGP